MTAPDRGELTSRELAVLAAVERRLSNSEIAAELVVSVRTVESHIAALRRKLGVDSRPALVAAAADRRHWLAEHPGEGGAAERRAQARAAAARRDWQLTYQAYQGIAERTGKDTEGLAEAAWWLGRMAESISLYTDAFRAHCSSDDLRGAARTSFLLAICTRLVGESAPAVGWMGRCQRVLESLAEGPEHGYPLYLQIAELMDTDLDAAVAAAQRMQDLGRRYADPTLLALGVYFEGRARVKQARVRDGLALLDEAMVAALSDELGPLWTGAIYCGLMDCCNELRDIRRAFEWTEATRRWCEPLPLRSLYPGICRVHRAQVLQVRGAWDQAEQEALGASQDMIGVDVFAVADAHYEIGEIRRLRGDFSGAEAAYQQAHEFGRDPQPGLSLLRLAQGRAHAALVSIGAALLCRTAPLARAPLLVAQSEIALAIGDLAAAEAAALTVAGTAETFDSAGLRADGWRCRGAVLLARGEVLEALPLLRSSCQAWQALDVPYEMARTRLLLADAYAALGDTEAAARDRAAAHACFERLGVLAAVPQRSQGLSAREVEVVTLIAAGKSNRAIAAELGLSEKTVARHVSNVFRKTGAGSRSAVTAFAYDTGLVSRNTHAGASAPVSPGLMR
jgi:DNA-binding NarL/FixJ family response regulator